MAGPSLNSVHLIGRLGRDVEMKYLPSGTQVANFSVATDETRKDGSGTKKEKTAWHKIIAFGKLAEICSEYLSKGSLAYLEGRLQIRDWEDKDGNKRQSTEIVCNKVVMLGGKKKKNGEDDLGDPGPGPDDDVPF